MFTMHTERPNTFAFRQGIVIFRRFLSSILMNSYGKTTNTFSGYYCIAQRHALYRYFVAFKGLPKGDTQNSLDRK
jgi:hypothetical protein